MPSYYINRRQTDGLNEVHSKGYKCGHEPALVGREPIGFAASIKEAVAKAKRTGWPDADSCWFCFNYELRQV